MKSEARGEESDISRSVVSNQVRGLLDSEPIPPITSSEARTLDTLTSPRFASSEARLIARDLDTESQCLKKPRNKDSEF